MFDFGNKKIVAVNYTRYVSIPKIWLNSLNIKKGDKVHIKMNDEKELVISKIN